MKKLILLITLTASTIYGNAQQRFKQKDCKQQYTAEQKAELRVKNLTTSLDLSKKQQKELENIFVTQIKEREAQRQFKRDRNNRSKNRAQRQENKILVQEKVKKVLTEQQYQEWMALKQDKKCNQRNGNTISKKRKSRLYQ